MKIREIISNKLSAKNITTFLTTVVPSVLNYFLISVLVLNNREVGEWLAALCASVSAILTFLFITLTPHGLALFKFFRIFDKYEGIWLQIIPDMEKRPFTILNLKYNKYEEKYEMHGNNYSKDLQQNVDFDAYYIVERRFKNGFYYITDQTADYTNGLGKVCFVQSNDDNLIRAKGYFFDESTKMCSKKYKTYFIKCDKNFFDMLNGGKSYMRIRKMPPKKIMECCKDFAFEELNRYTPHKAENNILCENCKKCDAQINTQGATK